ncbi:unnamed protein product [marine sediment metagenome]|uniref:Uncharacterized protein n=1 Tax=marine sediment metagenome TaxID=412755 RepID=X1EJ56_9ZZZZ
MATLKETAQTYIPEQTKNIADLPEVSIDLQLEDKEGKNKETGEVFKYKAINLNGEDYRVPGKVIGDIKAILALKPNLTKVKVNRTGVGLNTQYTVIPLD